MAQAAHGGHFVGPSRDAWASGVELFAGIMMMLIGLFQLAVGLTAITRSSLYVVADSYVFSSALTAWGWAHLALGVLVGGTGVALALRQSWARIVGIVMVSLSVLGNFLFLSYQPVWSLLIIAVDVVVIWSLAVMARESDRTRGAE